MAARRSVDIFRRPGERRDLYRVIYRERTVVDALRNTKAGVMGPGSRFAWPGRRNLFCGTPHSTAAYTGFHRRLLQHVEELHFLAVPGIGRERFREPAGILFSRVEGGLGHLQRRENPLGQERAERLAADDLDDAAEDVGGPAVVPFRAG